MKQSNFMNMQVWCTREWSTLANSTKDHMLTKHQFEIVPDNTTGVLKTKPTPGKTEIQKYYNFPTYDSYTDSPKTLIAVLYTLVRRITTKSKLKQIFSLSKSVLFVTISQSILKIKPF